MELSAALHAPNPQNFKSEHGRYRISAIPLLLRYLISSAFVDCCRCDDEGRPTPEAREAYDWLTCRLDWTGTHSTPPPALRSEFYLSFEWCCSWLDVDVDETREHGLPAPITLAHRVAHTNHHKGRHHISGMKQVREVWAARREQAVTVHDFTQCEVEQTMAVGADCGTARTMSLSTS